MGSKMAIAASAPPPVVEWNYPSVSSSHCVLGECHVTLSTQPATATPTPDPCPAPLPAPSLLALSLTGTPALSCGGVQAVKSVRFPVQEPRGVFDHLENIVRPSQDPSARPAQWGWPCPHSVGLTLPSLSVHCAASHSVSGFECWPGRQGARGPVSGWI